MATTPGNSISDVSVGITGFSGSAFVGTPVTQYNVLCGGSSSSTITNIAPSATAGVPLVSNGSSSNASFSKAGIAGGGTNANSFTQNNGIVTYNGTSLVNYAGPQISSSGIMTNTTQPCFFAYLSTSIPNATGQTIYTPVVFDTIEYDNASNYNVSTGLFTAPVTGKYFFSYQIVSTNTSGATVCNSQIITTSLTIQGQSLALAAVGANSWYYLNSSAILSMTAGDTAQISVFNVGGASNASTIEGLNAGSAPYNWFSGYLVC